MNFFFFSMGLTSLLDFCANPPGPPTKINMDNIALPEMYKITGGIATDKKYFKKLLFDFKKHTHTVFNEKATKDYRVLWRHSTDLRDRYVEELTGEQQYYHVNATDNKCTKNATKPNLINNPRFESILGNDTTSLNSIINGIIQFYKTNGGYIMKDSSENNMGFVACIDGATDADTKVMMEVGYLLQPNRTKSSKPLTMAIRMIEVGNYHWPNALSQVTIDLEQEYLPVGNKSFVLGGLSGIYSDGQSYLPFNPFDEFAGVFSYFDGITRKSSDIEVYYSKSRQLYIRATEDDKTRDESYFEFDPTTRFISMKGMNYIARDFKYGYEFTMRNGKCRRVRPLDDSTSDILFMNNTIESTILETMILDYNLKFDLYENEVDHLGRSFKVYRAFSDPLIYDVHVNTDNSIHSIAKRGKVRHCLSGGYGCIYLMYDGYLHDKITIIPTPIEESKLLSKLAQLPNCYDSGIFAKKTVLDSLRDKNITDLPDFVSNELSHDEATKSVKVDTVAVQELEKEKEESVDECVKICYAKEKSGLVRY